MTTKQDLIDAQLEAARIIKQRENRRAWKVVGCLFIFACMLVYFRACLSHDATGDMLAENRQKTAPPPFVNPN
jgi:hypothetical protein